MIKLLLTIALFSASLAITSSAAELPDEARRELKNLEKTINRKELEAEKRIARKKNDAIRTLEKIENKIDNEGIKGLINIQLSKYRKEIQQAQEKFDIGGNDKDENNDEDKESMEDKVKDAERTIDFDKSYFYKHPLEKYSDLNGELKFYNNGIVNCYHRKGLKVMMFKKWTWTIENRKLVVVGDRRYGPIIVTKKSPTELYLDWKGKVDKKIMAKMR